MREQTERSAGRPAFREKKAVWNDAVLSVQALDFPWNEVPVPRRDGAALHYHDYMELIYLRAGSLWARVGARDYRLKKGELLILRSGVPHTFFWETGRAYTCVKFDTELLGGSEDGLLPLPYRLPFRFDANGVWIIPADRLPQPQTEREFDWLLTEGRNTERGFQLLMRAGVLRLFGWIFRALPEETVPALPMRTETFLQETLAFVEQNLATVTQREAAAHSGLSYNYFSRLFCQSMHKTFNQYLTGRRVEEAARLLWTTDLSVEEIAFETGFGSTSYFIKRFREIKEQAPLQFRRVIRRAENRSAETEE